MDLTSAFVGITTPASDLYQQIAIYGWEPTKVAWDKGEGAFVAEAKNAHGEKVKKTGPNDRTALGNLLVAIMRHTHMRTAAQYKLGMWKTMFTDQLQPIAEAYAKAPVYDPKAAAAFKELADDSVRRAEVLGRQLHIEVVDDPEPYANVQEMADDIHNKRHFYVSRANSQHPLWSTDQNVAFRTVHDVLGHAVSGGDFGWQGENLACAAHFPLLTPTAQQALFTECIAQTAYAAFYRSFGPQKVALFPEFTDPSQAAENSPGHRGVHPSQSVAPVAMPGIPSSPSAETQGAQPEGTVAPHMEGLGLTPMMGPSIFSRKYASLLADPNAGWESGVQPMQLQTHGVGNAYLDHGDPLESNAVMDTANKIDTKWSTLRRGDGSFDRERAKLAIVNAFRVVLLSPRKDLRWNAIHYQDISHIPAGTDDPKVYWDTLERKRQGWNAQQVKKLYEGKVSPETLAEMVEEAKTSHQLWRKYYPLFFSIFYQRSGGDHDLATERAQRTLRDWEHDEQLRIEQDDSDKPAQKQKTADEVERRAADAVVKRMKLFIKDAQPKLDVVASSEDNYINELAEKILNECSEDEVPDGYDHDQVMTLFREYALLALTKGQQTTMEDVHDAWATWMSEHDDDHKSIKPFDELTDEVKEYDRPYMEYIHKHAGQEQMFEMDPEPVEKVDRYGAFMGTHLKAIAQVSQHADDLLDAALQDVQQHDGTGHHFRARVLSLGISGVGPKVASFAWLLLQPNTSQLATIDTHMMDVLGHNYEKAMNNRDYFKFERQLSAGRDAAGYSHIPLGAFQWGMWDHKRTGPGTHQDHSAMRVLDPVHHEHIDWESKTPNLKGEDWLNQAPDWWQNTQPARDETGMYWDQNVAPNFPQNAIPYQVLNQSKVAQVVLSGESKDEFHVGFTLPERVVVKLSAIAEELGIEDEEPENYHITAFWSEHGYERHELHDWIRQNSVNGLRFTNARLDSFPTQDNRYAVVLRFDAPEAKKLTNKLMDEAEDHGLEIKRFDGGWKAHVTLGWSDEPLALKTKYPEIEFRAGPLYISIPRPLRRTAGLDDPAPWASYADGEQDVGAPGETVMQFARLMHPGLSTPEIWKLLGEEGAGKLNGSGRDQAAEREGSRRLEAQVG